MSAPASRPQMLRAVMAAATLLAIALAAAPAPAETGDRIRIAIEGARPPYNMLDQKGELAGFEVDLARALCARLALACQLVQQEWDQLLPGLAAGSHDAVISALTPTPERRAQARFGAPYVRMPLAFAGPRGRTPRPVDAASLAGLSIGVEDGAPQEAWLERAYPRSTIRRYASLEEAMLDLAAGRVDVVVGAKDVVAAFIDTRREARCCRLLADAPSLDEGFAMAFRPGDDALRAKFDKALADLRADGGYETIRRRYFAWPIIAPQP